MRIRGLVAALGLVLTAHGTAQEIIDTRWSLDDDGRLRIEPLWHVGGDGVITRGAPADQPELVFGALLGGDRSLVGLFDWSPLAHGINLLFTGVRDGASRTDAVRLFEKLGQGTSLQALSYTAGSLPRGEGRRRRRAELDRLLALRIAEQTHNEAAILLFKPDEDPFVRRAALDAYRAIGAEILGDIFPDLPAIVPPREEDVERAFTALPAGGDVLVSVLPREVPEPEPLLRARASLLRAHATNWMSSSGGSISPAMLLSLQLASDTPSLLPYEVALRFGNWRIDHALLGLRLRDGVVLSARIAGRFQPERARRGLEDEGLAPTGAGDTVRASVADTDVTISRELLTIASRADRGATGTAPAFAAEAVRHPIWVHAPGPVPALGALGAFTRATLTVDFTPACRVELRVVCADDAAARAWETELGRMPGRVLAAVQARDRARFGQSTDPPLSREDLEEIARQPAGVQEDLKTEFAPVQFLEALDVRRDGRAIVVTVPPAWLTPERVVRVASGLGLR